MTTIDKHVAEPSEPLITGNPSYSTVTDTISDIVLKRPITKNWLLGFGVSFALMMVLLYSIGYLFARGLGIWGINNPVGWGFAIINFVWWIGIGHAGTLISAILFLLNQQWRTSINRFAEAMTLFAVACAGLFPLLHMGRPWLFYWLMPYPNTMGMWPQFRSPLVWDVFAVSTYATISLVFWYTGLIPDLATMRDRATSWFGKVVYGIMAMGWRGSARHWRHYEKAYLVLAGLATPLVISVHTVVSFDFAVSVVPGWHLTVFPPYFVAGAIYAGFAMVLTLMLPIRHFYSLQGYITERHLNCMAKIMLVAGLIVAYGYAAELFFAWYSGNPFEEYMVKNRKIGPYAPFYIALILCNVIIPQLLWSAKIRKSLWGLFLVSMAINVGMWLERFIIVVTSLHRDFMPSAWGMYAGTVWDWSTYIGTIGLFLSLIYLFVRLLPMISIFEIRSVLPEPKPRSPKGGA